MFDFPPIMTLDQAAAYLCISPDTMYAYAQQGKFPGFKLGNRWRFRKEDIDQRIQTMVRLQGK